MSLPKPYYQDSACTIYHGDCREILPLLPKVDLVLTDPPYGVNLGEVDNGQAREKKQVMYSTFSDTPEHLKRVIIPAFEMALSISKRAMLTTGNRNAWLYPKPDDVGVWYNPAGCGRGKWGYILAHLILFYGKDPRAGKNATASSTWSKADSVADLKQTKHPCPKPLRFTKWMVEKASIKGETILDPFMGSGTTLRAAKDLGRKAIGIEIEKKYCDIAVQRLRQEVLL